jgi:hypothetical protein
MSRRDPMSKSLVVLGTAVAGALALALVLSTAPLLGRRGSTAYASTRCTGGGGGGTPTPTPTTTSTSSPGPLPSLTLPPPIGGTPTPTPTGTASPTGSPTASPTTTSADLPEPAQTTPTGAPTSSPTEPGPQTTRRCDSEITLQYAPNRQRFSGRVKSNEEACTQGRRVQLKRDRKKGRDRTVARTVTNNRGRFQMPLPDRSGRRFYAVTPKQRVVSGGEDVICNSDRSRSVSTKNPL